MRILAAYFPAWPLQVAARATPGLRPRARGGVAGVAPPFAVADAEVSPADPGSREVGAGVALLAVSAAARRAGVRPGMTVAQACAVCPALVVRPVDPAAHEVARIAIAEVLSGFGPTVEVDEPWSTGFADVTGDREEAARPRALEEALKRAGFTARAAIASSRFTARTVAAFGGATGRVIAPGERRVIAPGEERAALATVAVEALALPSTSSARPRTLAADPITAFRKLGLTTLGEVARLPADALARRFGGGAAQLAPLARGDDATPLTPFRLPDALFEKVDLPAPAAALEALLFPMRMLVDRVCARLEGRGRTAARLALHLVLEEWGRAAPSTTVELRLPRPSASAKTILEVARERLAPLSLPGPVSELAVEVVEWVPARRAQLDLFARATPPPERLAVTLGRLASAFGHEAVFAAELVAEYRPERAFRAGPLPSSDGDEPARTKGKRRPRRVPPPDAATPPGADAPIRPVRVLRVPEPVTLHPGPRGTEVVVRGRRLQVVGMDGPERLSGDWWERAFDRDYFRVRTEEGSQWWLFQDRAAGSWHLHGLFD